MPNKSKPAARGPKEFTVITKRRVLRVKARSIQHLTQALREVGIAYQGIHEDGR